MRNALDWKLGESRNHHKVLWLKMPDGREHHLRYPAQQRTRLSHENKQFLKRIGGHLI